MAWKATAHAMVELSSRRVQHVQQKDTADGSPALHSQRIPWVVAA